MTYNELIRDSRMLYAAWFPQTKRYFLTQEDGLCAVIFPEQADLDRYALKKKEEGIRVDAVENPIENRDLLLADFWRSGITKVRIEGSQPVILPLSELYSPPDYSAVPPAKRPVPDPALTGVINLLLQRSVLKTADKDMVFDVLHRLREASLFGPAVTQPDGSMGLPVFTPHETRLALLFTDTREFGLVFHGEDIETKRFDFEDIIWLLNHNFEAVAINYASGVALMLDKTLLQAAGML
ncbi:MAG: SseB family protein [Oscillospiraceae bacterium]|nr:SseB family protein [Oscillospiraceae bacterium]